MIIANSLSFWRSYFIIYYPFCDFTTILLLISWIIVFTIFLRNHFEATFSQVIFEFTMIIMILLSFMRIHYDLTTIMANLLWILFAIAAKHYYLFRDFTFFSLL